VGRPLHFTGSATASASIITDHPIWPKFFAEMRLFSGGFIIEKMNGQVCIPLVISFAQHVESVCTMDFHDCFIQMKDKILMPYLRTHPQDASFISTVVEQLESMIPDGYLIVYRLRSLKGSSGSTALDRICPSYQTSDSECGKHLAVCVRYNDGATGSSNNITSSVTEHWRAAMRLHDVSEFKGKDVDLTTGVLKSFSVLLDDWLAPKTNDETFYRSSSKLSSGNDIESISVQEIASFAVDYQVRYGLPGCGITSMRSMHAISEAQRLSAFDYQSLLFSDEQEVDEGIMETNSVDLMVVAGLAGSGVEIVGAQLYQQLHNGLISGAASGNSEYATDLIKLDFTQLVDSSKDIKTNQAKINSFIEGKLKFGMRSTANKKLVLVVLCVIGTAVYQDFHDLITLLGSVTSSRVKNVTVVASPDQLLTKR
jgi:hypothetical protein